MVILILHGVLSMSNTLNNQLQYSDDFENIEDGQLCYENGHIIFRDGNARVDMKEDACSQEYAEENFIRMGNLPIDRFGDNTYVPLDIKGDFKGSVCNSDSASAILVENDGSIVGLRGGYNGDIKNVFYFYSISGLFDESNIILTDQLYEPPFLRKDANVSEYVAAILNSNRHGMFVRIRDHFVASYNRYYWISFNGTMDSQYHSYTDLTDTYVGNNYGSITYIPERDMFIGTKQTIVQFVFFNNNLPRRWEYVGKGTISSTLTAKSLTVTNEFTGVTSSSSSFMMIDNTTLPNYLVSFPNANGSPVTFLGHPRASHGFISKLVYEPIGTDIVCSVRYSFRVVHGDGSSNNGTIYYRFKITSSGVVSLYNNGNSATEQLTFPYVLSINNSGLHPNATEAQRQKVNKYPLTFDADYFHNETVVPQSNGMVLATMQRDSVNTHVTFYEHRQMAGHYIQKPRILSGGSDHMQTTQFTIVPVDASPLGKQPSALSFIDENTIRFNSNSMLSGEQSITNKRLVANLDPASTRTLDYGTAPATALLSNIHIATASELTSVSVANGTAYFKSGEKYRNIPYHSSLDALNGKRIYVYDGFDVDTTLYADGLICEFPQTTETNISNLLVGYYATKGLGSYDVSRATVNFVSDDNGVATLLCTFSASVVTSKIAYGCIILKCPIDQNRVLDMSNVYVHADGSLINTNTTNRTADRISSSASYGVYYGDNSILICTLGTGFALVGSNVFYHYAVELDYSGDVIRSKIVHTSASWNEGTTFVHPYFGFGTTDIFTANQTRVVARYAQSNAQSSSERIEDSFEKLFNGTNIVSKVVVTTEPPENFTIYVSQTPLIFQGRQYILPTLSIDMLSEFTNPYNKTFYAYIRRTSSSEVIFELLETEQPESFDVMYVGSVSTTNSGIANIAISKRTRINMQGLTPINNVAGSSIPVNTLGSPNQSVDNSVRYALMFGDDDAQRYRSLFTPPTAQAILSNWARTDAQLYYANGAAAPSGSDAKAWQLNNNTFAQPNNSTNLVTLLSDDKLDRYVFDATLTSNDGDNDYIGLVIAGYYANNEYHALVVGAHTGGLPSHKFSLQLITPSITGVWTAANVLQGENGLATRGGWTNASLMVRVVKDRNIVKVYRGAAWGSTALMSEPIFTFDIYSLENIDHHAFAEKVSYGFASMSQPNSRYLNYNIELPVAYSSSVVYNTSNQKYIFNVSSGTWTLAAQTPSTELAYPRVIINPLTKVQYKFNSNGAHVVIRDDAVQYSDGFVPTIVATPNMTVNFSSLAPLFSSTHGAIEIVQLMTPVGCTITGTSASHRTLNPTASTGSFYVCVRAGEVISFRKINFTV